MPKVVVGIDGSRGSDEALRFAAEEALLRGATLEVVSVWDPATAVSFGGPFVPSFDLHEEVARQAQTLLDETLARVALDPGLTVVKRVLSGHPADVLVAEAAEADLLVVGSRGHGGFASLLLGSVGQQVAHHARCPVIVGPAGRGG
jgi:nucleotide-binding universal stress UspA family protein